jgi:hypothetical protein
MGYYIDSKLQVQARYGAYYKSYIITGSEENIYIIP